MQQQSHKIIDEKDQLRIIVIGATSGIGLAIARQYLAAGHLVGLTGRRENLLQTVQTEYWGTAYIQAMDISKAVLASAHLENLIEKMKGVDIVIINAGVGYINPKLEWDKQSETIAINVLGFTAIASTAMSYFLAKGKGHLVGISSIAGIRGSDEATDYAASKAYCSNYLAGLRKKSNKARSEVCVTDVLPGFVDTAMGQSDKRFWVSTTTEAASQIIIGIRQKRSLIYVTKRWRLVAWAMKIMPDFLFNRI